MHARAAVLPLLAAIVVACAGTANEQGAAATEGDAASVAPRASAANSAGAAPIQYTTNHSPDGNRYLIGRGALDVAEPVDIPLDGVPVWVVGVPVNEGVVWIVALETGELISITMPGGDVQRFGELPAGTPPALALAIDGSPSLVRTAAQWGAPATHPVLLPGGGVAWVDSDGSLHVMSAPSVAVSPADVFAVGALPDSRILVDGDRLMLVTGPTDRYGHGVLGDAIEGESVTIVDSATGEIAGTIDAPGAGVFEGATLIWADLDGDGVREITATVSDAEGGAGIVVFSEAGDVIASGPTVGRGGRWRHQIAIAPFGPGGELELVDVLTPHIGGVVEFYRLSGDRLEVVAEVSGFRSHALGSRNLDMALAVDADGDGRVELLVPAQDLRTLAGIRRTDDGAEVVWLVPLGGVMTTNLGAVASPDGSISFAVGRSDGVLRLWR